MSILSKLVVGLHLLIVAYVVVAPFLPWPVAWAAHSALVFSILAHWGVNHSECILTVVEARLRGVEPSQTFLERLLAPIYNPVQAKAWLVVGLLALCFVSIGRSITYPLYAGSKHLPEPSVGVVS